MNIIPMRSHPMVLAAHADDGARRVAARFGLAPTDIEQVASKARALVFAGCSAGWAVAMARRFARRTARSQGGAA